MTTESTRGMQFDQARQALNRLADSPDTPQLRGRGTRSVEAWFLGPKAENADVLERLIVEAVRDQAFWRRNYHPGDPDHITESIKRHPDYLEAMDGLRDGFHSLLAFLKKSVPFFSMRYQGHMNWDVTLPGVLGYFTAMLYNPNNVAFEGSTATTLLELLVGDDLCRMLGYKIPSEAEVARGAIRPWGHITCDGTVANIEAIWAARNVKFYPVAMQAALKDDTSLAAAQKLTVETFGGGRRRLLDLDPWTTLNLGADEILKLPSRLSVEFGISRETVTRALSTFTVQNLGMAEFQRRFLPDFEPPVFLVPGTKHYSFPKAAAILGIGASNMIDVPVDLDTRMDAQQLQRILTQLAEAKRPVLAVVCVMGSTEESSIDPIARTVELRDELRRQSLDFLIHADAAWGGYHASVLRDDFDMPQPLEAVGPPARVPLSRYVASQFQHLPEADSITVDPHKSGYIPYPAGALCYRNSAMRDLLTFSAPVVFHGEAEPTVGIYGVEGSKPGAAAASVYLSHRVIRPSKSGYGKIIGQALYSCKALYARLLCMAKNDDPFIITPVPRLPAEREGGDVDAQRKFIATNIDGRSNAEIQQNPAALHLLPELGPDENILSYAFNFKTSDGAINANLELANRLNRALYQQLSIDPGQDIYGYDLIVSTTDLDVTHYGSAFIEDYKHRLGVGSSPGTKITVLRSVVMDPWVTETESGSFIDVLEAEFRKAVVAALQEVHPQRTRGY